MRITALSLLAPSSPAPLPASVMRPKSALALHPPGDRLELSAAISPTLLPVPRTRQSTEYSCGAAALQAVLQCWGMEFNEAQLMRRLETDPQSGTRPQALVRVAQELGLQAELREQMTLEELERLTSLKIPVIVDAQAWRTDEHDSRPWRDVWESGHYMVVVGLDQDNVYFMDPSMLGSTGFIPRAEFLERWHDTDDQKRYYNSGVVIKGPRPAPPPPFLPIP